MTSASHARTPRPDGSRPKNPVRRDSKPAGGEWERSWTVTWSPGELARHGRVMRAHRARLRTRRRTMPDRMAAAELPVPTKNGLDILNALAAMAAGGRRLLVLSYRELARRADCSVATVRRQIAVLKAAGMLDWQRRCRRTENPPEFGAPQWEQAENVYRLRVPEGVKREHRRAGAEVDRRRADETAARASAQRQASGSPIVREGVARGLQPGGLAEVFDRLGRAMHEKGRTPKRPGLQGC